MVANPFKFFILSKLENKTEKTKKTKDMKKNKWKKQTKKYEININTSQRPKGIPPLPIADSNSPCAFCFTLPSVQNAPRCSQMISVFFFPDE